jgi:hypothetical protein
VANTAQLEQVVTFLDRTGLIFEELIRLTAVNQYYRSVNLGGDPREPVTPAIYGACYVNASAPDAYLEVVGDRGKETLKNMYLRNLDRINRFVRLHFATGLGFETLDWLYQQTTPQPSDTWRPDEQGSLHNLLVALGEYRRLNKQAPLQVDEFAAYIGELNGYAERDALSFFDSVFNPSGVADRLMLPTPAPVIFDPKDDSTRAVRMRLCRGLGVPDPVLCHLATFLPSTSATALLDVQHVSALYRLVALPRRLGLSVVEALLLWQVLNPSGEWVRTLAGVPSMDNLAILQSSEVVVDWLRANQLDVASLQLLLSRTYRTTATPELNNFLSNLYTSIKAPDSDATPDHNNREGAPERPSPAAALTAKLAKHLGTLMGVSTLAAITLIRWADALCRSPSSGAPVDYTHHQFWGQLQEWYLGSKTEAEKVSPARRLESLEVDYTTLIQYTHLLIQLASWGHWGQLTEQDLEFVVSRPSLLGVDGAVESDETPPLLSLALLLSLSRFKAWQKQVQVPIAEALRYFPKAQPGSRVTRSEGPTATWAAEELTTIHGWDADQVKAAMQHLYGANGYPTSFQAFYPLAVRMQLSERLGISVQNLQELESLAVLDDETQIRRVADALMAGLQDDAAR